MACMSDIGLTENFGGFRYRVSNLLMNSPVNHESRFKNMTRTFKFPLHRSAIVIAVLIVAIAITTTDSASAQDQNGKPNILVIMVDDVAPNALSAYSHGMQYPTPNIDRIAKRGILFTDH